jgi:hypothetical protein
MPRGRPRKKPDNALMKTADLFGWALGGLEREISQTRERLASLNAQAAKLRLRLAGSKGSVSETVASVETTAPKRKRRRRMSAEARKRMSEMTKKRWAERKKKGLTRL